MKSYTRIQVLIQIITVHMLLYILTNRFHFFPPVVVADIFFDEMILFNPQWVWVYLYAYPFIVAPALFLKDINRQKAYLIAFFSTTLFCSVIFLFYPTTVPRPEYDPSNGFASFALSWLQVLDAPTNCLPSAHVALSLLSAGVLASTSSRFLYKKLMWVFFLLISYSTMALKQHNALDVISGFFVGACAFSIYSYRLALLEKRGK